MPGKHRKRLLKHVLYLTSSIAAAVVMSACVTTPPNNQHPNSYQLENKNAYRMFGGPGRGQFRHFAEGISEIAMKNGIEMAAIETIGSFENVRRVDSDRKGFSLAYSTHIYQARNGLLWNDSKKYEDIMVLGYFFGSHAHLVVKAQDNITSAMQLAGKRVAIGRAGSGYVDQAKKLFEHLGIWNKIQKQYIHHSEAVNAFRRGEIDAFWVISSFPNGAVMKAAAENNIHLINLYKDGQKSGFFKKYPFFAKAVIPGARYRNVDQDTQTYLDATLWIANRNVPDEVVYRMMENIYSNEGIERLTQRTRLARNLRSNDGKLGITMPLHPGAKKYYQDKGLFLSDDASPEDLYNEGEQFAKQGRHAEAIESYRRVLKSEGNTARQKALVHFQIGISYAFLNDQHNAIDSFVRAIQQNPNFAVAYAALGVAHLSLGKINEAIQDLSHAIELNHNIASAYHSRAVAFMKLNRFDEALTDFNKTISLDPQNIKAWKNRAAFYLRTNRKQSALIDLEKAIRLAQGDVDLYKTAAWLYATDPSPKIRDGHRALELAKKALALSKDASTLNVLAAAHAELGNFELAVGFQRQAIEMASTINNSQRRLNLEKHLESYRNNKPWRSKYLKGRSSQ